MPARTRVGLAVMVAAIVLGIWIEWLYRGPRLGINALLICGGLVGAVMLVATLSRTSLQGGGKWLMAASLLFAALLAWRDSSTLNGLAIVAMLTCLGVGAARLRSGELRTHSLTEYAADAASAGLHGAGGVMALTCSDVEWSRIPRPRNSNWGGLARGILLAIPLVFVFGALFRSADAVFANGVNRLTDWNGAEFLGHAVLAVLFGCVAAGWMRQALVRPEAEPAIGPKPEWLGLGIVETGVVLGALNALFAAFVAVQFRYFFGGDNLVQVTPNFTYADYARGGFFELVTVVALVLPLLLFGDWLLRREKRSHGHLFRGLAGLLVVQLFVIIASALERMRLYQVAYGLTELRVYVSAVIIWLGIVFVWFAATVLRGQRERFAFGMLVSALLTVIGLHIWNPDERIVRANLALLQRKDRIDTDYVVGLSADAVPAILIALPELEYPRRAELAGTLHYQWVRAGQPQTGGRPAPPSDWRAWNLGRVKARQALTEAFPR